MSQPAPRILSRIPFGPIVCITFALILGFSTPVSADPEGELYFQGNNYSSYYRINLDNGLFSNVTNLGSPGGSGYSGLASVDLERYLLAARTSNSGGSYFRTILIEENTGTTFPFNGSSATGLAYDPSEGVLYVSNNNTLRAYIGSAYTDLPLPYSSADFHGLAWGQGGLFALEWSDQALWFYDPIAQAWENRGSTGINNWRYSGLAYRPDIDRLYGVNDNCRLYEIDPNTGSAVDLGSISSAQQSPCGGGLAWLPNDCDQNGIADYQDVLDGATDCNGNQVPDICEPDCDQDGVLDECAITTGTSADCDSNGIPDECDEDCDGNGLVDQCEINGGLAQDCDGNGIINPCEPDCDGNGLADACELLGGLASDCDNNGVIDSCDEDCDGNGLADACELLAGTIGDCDGNGIIDPCEIDCDLNGVADVCEGRKFVINQPGSSIGCCSTFGNTILVSNSGLISDVDVKASVSGAWQSSYRISVTSPSGTTVSNLHNVLSSSITQLNVVWSDTLELGTQPPDNFSTTMTAWIGEPAAGNWTMSINRINSDGGTGVWQEWGISLLTDAMPEDCDQDGIPDSCEPDCNANGIPDDCDIGNGFAIPYQSALSTPLPINNASPATSVITILEDNQIGDLDVFVHYSHASDCEIQIQLTSPAGTTITLKDFGGSCNSVSNRIRFSDQGENGYLIPLESLSESFIGQTSAGDWQLTITQGAIAPSGSLLAWALLNQIGGEDLDCDGNGIPDSCEISSGVQVDCNTDGIPDICQIASSPSLDCDGSGVLDQCEISDNPALDCNQNEILDVCEIAEGIALDCNQNFLIDLCEIGTGVVSDCNLNEIPDDCELIGVMPSEFDKDTNFSANTSGSTSWSSSIIVPNGIGLIEDLDVQVDAFSSWGQYTTVRLFGSNGTSATLFSPSGSSNDYSGGYYNDEGGIQSVTPLSVFDQQNAAGTWTLNMTVNPGNTTNRQLNGWSLYFTYANENLIIGDCDGNGILDSCEIVIDPGLDCDSDGILDSCFLEAFPELDCNQNGLLDVCDIESGYSVDCDGNGIPDECFEYAGVFDCNLNGVPDSCDIASTLSTDCDGDSTPDECQIFQGTASDCDGNGVSDFCDLEIGEEQSYANLEEYSFSFFSSAVSTIEVSEQGVAEEGITVHVEVQVTDPASLIINQQTPWTSFDISGSSLDWIQSDSPDMYTAEISLGGRGRVFEGTYVIEIQDTNLQGFGALLGWGIRIIPTALNDCNGNGILDRCESDCNGNGVADDCEVSEVDVVKLNPHFSQSGSWSSSRNFYIYFDKDIQVSEVRVLLFNSGLDYNYEDLILYTPGGMGYTVSVNSNSQTSGWREVGCVDDPIPAAVSCIPGSVINFSGSLQGLWRLNVRHSSSGGGNWSLGGFGLHGIVDSSLTSIADCDGNLFPDDCDLSSGTGFDCNNNGVLDSCDAAQGTVYDCNGNGIADLCEYGPETDCNGNGILDDCDVLNGIEGDCDGDGVLDSCEVAAGASDCDANEIPDECQPDCDANGTADPCDIASGAADCDADGVLDVCETDCNANGVPDDCDLAAGTSEDCDGDGQPDECQLITGFVDCDNNGLIDVCQLFVEPDLDCDANGTIDFCELLSGTGADCDNNGVLDPCDIAQGYGDCDNDGLPDICEPDDCDGDGVPDACALASGLVEDCDGDELPDSCGIVSGIADDCDGNGIPDICTLITGIDTDCDLDNVLDACQIIAGASDCDQDGYLDSCALAEGSLPDCDGNGVIDSCDLAAGTSADADGDGIPDLCQSDGFIRGECNGDGSISIADAVFLLDHLFVGGPAGPCVKACDGNDDGGVDLSDVIYSLTYLFNGGAPPPHPWPDCGPDPTSDSLPCATAPVCP